MNKERLLQVRQDILDAHGGVCGFNMGDFVMETLHEHEGYSAEVIEEWSDRSGHSCGTVACIAGHAAIRRLMEEHLISVEEAVRRANNREVPHCDFEEYAGEWLGLTREQRMKLFYAYDAADLNAITVEQATAAIDHLIETGEVHWADGPENQKYTDWEEED